MFIKQTKHRSWVEPVRTLPRWRWRWGPACLLYRCPSSTGGTGETPRPDTPGRSGHTDCMEEEGRSIQGSHTFKTYSSLFRPNAFQSKHPTLTGFRHGTKVITAAALRIVKWERADFTEAWRERRLQVWASFSCALLDFAWHYLPAAWRTFLRCKTLQNILCSIWFWMRKI